MGTIIGVFVPIVAILCGMLAIYVRHKERMAMIEKGIKPEELRRTEAHKLESMLIGGLVVIGIGLAFLVTQFLATLSKWLVLPGFILSFIGVALIGSYYIVGKLQKGK